MGKPDYSRYGRKQLWTAIEASCLLADIEPVPFAEFMPMYNAAHARRAVEIDGDLRDSFEIYSDMKDSFDLGRLEFREARPNQLGERYLGQRLVRPVACIEWAHRRRWNVPAKLAAAVEQSEESAETVAAVPNETRAKAEPVPASWQAKAVALYREFAAQHPNEKDESLSERIAAQLKDNGVRGRGGKILSAATIRRHALQGILRTDFSGGKHAPSERRERRERQKC